MGKQILRLTESQLTSLIEKMVLDAKEGNKPALSESRIERRKKLEEVFKTLKK